MSAQATDLSHSRHPTSLLHRVPCHRASTTRLILTCASLSTYRAGNVPTLCDVTNEPKPLPLTCHPELLDPHRWTCLPASASIDLPSRVTLPVTVPHPDLATIPHPPGCAAPHLATDLSVRRCSPDLQPPILTTCLHHMPLLPTRRLVTFSPTPTCRHPDRDPARPPPSHCAPVLMTAHTLLKRHPALPTCLLSASRTTCQPRSSLRLAAQTNLTFRPPQPHMWTTQPPSDKPCRARPARHVYSPPVR